MNAEQMALAKRAAIHAALADPARLRIVDRLAVSDAASSELAAMLDMPSNLIAHHLRALIGVGLVTRHRSEGDRRRSYLRLVPGALTQASVEPTEVAQRVLFICTANSARSHLAAALWRQASGVPAVSAGTHPADRIDPGAIDAAKRHQLPLPRLRPRHLAEVQAAGDLIITVCDRAHEELSDAGGLHWSVPDPVPSGDVSAFDLAVAELAHRIDGLAPRLVAAS